MCQCFVSVRCESFQIFLTDESVCRLCADGDALSMGPAGRLAALSPAAADDNMRPVSPQLCVQYASECSWHVKLDKPRDAAQARLRCELVPELPKIKLRWLAPTPLLKMRPRRGGNGLWKPASQTPRPLAQVRVSDCRPADSSSWMVASALSAPAAALLIKARPWPPLRPAGSH